jgi:hypothetical protein
MAKKDVGQGAASGFDKAENAVGPGRNADNGNEVNGQDDPEDEKFKGVPPIHVFAHFNNTTHSHS